MNIKCVNCENVLEKGDKYILDPYFDEPCCLNCYSELKQNMIENEDWVSLQEMEYKEWKEVGNLSK